MKDRKQGRNGGGTVGLSMIVRNEAAHLRRCLESARLAVDEIVVVDTGSTDETQEIARDCGARVVEIPWEEDFAKARNRALAEMRTAWVLSLDADEMLDPAAGSEIRKLTVGKPAAYMVTIRNYLGSLQERLWDRQTQANDGLLAEARAYPAYAEHENVRLFRRDPGIYFVGRVHESVGSRVQALGLPLGVARFRIHHFGLAGDDPGRDGKNLFYRELGRQKVAEMPHNPQAHFELGLAERDPQAALASFARACELKPDWALGWYFVGVAQLRFAEPRAALAALERAESCGQQTAACAELRGDAAYESGQFDIAREAYGQALSRGADEAFLVEGKLGLAEARAGEMEGGLRRLQQVLARAPKLAANHDRLIQLQVWRGEGLAAAQAAEQKLRQIAQPTAADFQRCAALWAAQGHSGRAAAVLHVGRQVHPGVESLQQAIQELTKEQGGTVNQIVAALERRS